MTSDHTNFWAKAHPDANAAVAFHSLIAHSLDVAAVALLLPGRPALEIDARMLGLLVAVHDIGKISRPFQAKAPAYWPHQALAGHHERPPETICQTQVWP